MTIDWKPKSPIHEVVKYLNDLLGLNEKGEVTLGLSGTFDVYVGIVKDSLRAPAGVPERTLHQFVHRAIINSKKAKDLSAERILAEVQASARKYLAKRREPFVLLGSLSIKNTLPLPTTRLGEAVITFLNERPRNFAVVGQGSTPRDPTPRGYKYVKVRVLARDPNDAADIAFEALDFVRGLWNWDQTYKQWRVTFGAVVTKPVNPILLGPHFTLHHPDGSATLDHQWWHTSGPHGDPYVPKGNGVAQLKKTELRFRRRIAKSAFAPQLRELVIRYCRSQDDDIRTSYVNLWAFLETITGTGTSSYDVTVRRAAFVFDDVRRAQVSLSYLRAWRNRIVHESRHSDEMETLLYELKHFADHLLGVLLSRSEQFNNLGEFYEFLDLPSEPALLRRREKVYRYGRRFRTP